MFKLVRYAIIVVTVLSSSVAQDLSPSGPRRTLDSKLEAMMTARAGHHPFEDLRAWARKEKSVDDIGWLSSTPNQRDTAAREVLLCALWSKDPLIEFAAACHLPEHTLDLRDIDRWVTAVWPHAFDENCRYDWDTFKHLLDSKQVARILDPKSVWKADLRSHFIDDLHRSFRPEHIGALCKLLHHDDPIIRRQALGSLDLLSRFTDQYREQIAIELLQWPGPSALEVLDYDDPTANPKYVPRKLELPRAASGYPPLLSACLQRWLLENEAPSKRFHTVLARWAKDSTPGEEDRALLCRLLHSSSQSGQWIALRGLRQLPLDKATERVIRQFARDADPEQGTHALAATGQIGAIQDLARSDAAALALALEIDEDASWHAWAQVAFGSDPASGKNAISRLADARDLSRLGTYCYPPGIRARLRTAIDHHAADLDFERLAVLARLFPTCRTQVQADRILSKLTLPGLPKFGLATMLEVHDVEQFRAKLNIWAKGPASSARNTALRLLMQLGSARFDTEILEFVRSEEDAIDLFLLARSGGSTTIRRHLEQALEETEHGSGTTQLAAMAAARGIPEPTARAWARHLEKLEVTVRESNWNKWAHQVIHGDPVTALVTSLSAFPIDDQCFTDLGLVKDERVRTLLRRVRNTPGVNVQEAIAQLALAGDKAAQAQMNTVRSLHLYGWSDSIFGFSRAGGVTLALLPYWLAEIETVCCRRNVASQAIELVTLFETHRHGEYALSTQHQHAELWWKAVRDHLRWSRIANRFVIAPH